MPAVEYKNVLLISGFWNILKILKTTFILALCSPLPNSASGCCGSFYTSTTAAAHCHTSVNIQQWRRRRQRSGEAEAQKPKCSLRSCSPRMKLWSEFFDDTGIFFVALGWVSNSVLAILSKFMPHRGEATLPKPNKLAKARKTRKSPCTLGLRKFRPGKLWVEKVLGPIYFYKFSCWIG